MPVTTQGTGGAVVNRNNMVWALLKLVGGRQNKMVSRKQIERAQMDQAQGFLPLALDVTLIA